MSAEVFSRIEEKATWTDRYFVFLAVVLVGYAVLGKGFAYLGAPPLFIGEIALLLGILAFMRTGCFIAIMTSVPLLILTLLILWVLYRTVPYIRIYRFDALRDSVIAVYGAFSFIVVALLLEKPERLRDVLRYFAGFTAFYGTFSPFVYYLSKMGGGFLPKLPWADVPILFLRAGEVSVHVAGAVVFALLGMRRVGVFSAIMLVLAMAMVAAQSRGGMLAILVPAVAAAIVGGKAKAAAKVGALAVAVLAIGYVFDIGVVMPPDPRVVGTRQIVDNFLSVFFQSNDGALDGTKEFRVRWWQAIQDYTIHGQYFWTGKGFGINLAEADGFVVGEENGGPLLRSPHNGNMTILARAGVPGLTLWLLLLFSWFAMMGLSMLRARFNGEKDWFNLFLFLGCYLAAILINASFDVAIEGPMLGIWFWVIFGLGVGAAMIYRSQPAPSVRRAPSLASGGAVAGALLLFCLPSSARADDLNQATSGQAYSVEEVNGKNVANPKGSCVAFKGLKNATIENVTAGPCANHGILIADSENVTIRNVTINNAGESGIYIIGSKNVQVEESSVTNTISGVVAVSSQGVRVSCNTIIDVRGPIPSGQFIQFNEVTGAGNEVMCNLGRNTPGAGNPEDAISMYRSSGTEQSPITIANNLIVGGGPSESGGGIMLGDDGGTYITARSNVLVDPGQYGIGVASGEHMSVVDNLIFGKQQPFTNVGIYVWNQYPHTCNNITVRGNHVRWQAKSGKPNPWWDGENCGAITGVENNRFSAVLTPRIEEIKAPDCSCKINGRK